MKKMIAMLLALVMAMSLMACGKQNDSNANDNNDANTGDDQPAAKTTLVVGVSADYAPFEFMYPDENGNMVYGGIDISVAQYVADELGLTLQVENMSFNNLLTSLDKGDFDMVLSAMEATPDRLENADFSTGYYSDTPPAILVKADKADQYKTLADFNDKAMGAQAATTKLDMVNDIEGVNAVSLESVLDLVNELVYDKVDAILVDGGVAQQYADANPDLVICSASSELPWPRATPRACWTASTPRWPRWPLRIRSSPSSPMLTLWPAWLWKSLPINSFQNCARSAKPSATLHFRASPTIIYRKD